MGRYQAVIITVTDAATASTASTADIASTATVAVYPPRPSLAGTSMQVIQLSVHPLKVSVYSIMR